MTENQPSIQRAAVCEVHLDQIDQGIGNLHGYSRAFVVFRLRGSVIGQAWVRVINGYVAPATLRAHLPATAWTVWKQVMDDQPRTGRLPSASVVVCTRDRTADLANCLPGLQRLAAQGHDVIVVDNAPSDNATARLVAGYPMIRYVLEPRPGLDSARNSGLRAARGAVVAFTDDDAQVDASWLAALLRNFDDPMVAIVTGLTMPLELETAAQLWFEETNGFGRGFERQQFDSTNKHPLAAGAVGAGVNMAIRRDLAFGHVGLFDEALDCGTPALTGGDQEYFYRALERGYRIVYEPNALVWHKHRREWESLRKTVYSYGAGVYAWWMRALLVEGEWTLLKAGPRWFWQHHVRQYLRALLRRPGHVPYDLALAELRGALTGPGRYLRSRRWLRELPATQLLPEPQLVEHTPLDAAPRLVEQAQEYAEVL
jgi:GT2 family glycosyltransferase